MGVGILSLPYAFERFGLILSPIFVLIVTLLSLLTLSYIFDVRSRHACNLTLTVSADIGPGRSMCIAGGFTCRWWLHDSSHAQF
jgi:amino acid permease